MIVLLDLVERSSLRRIKRQTEPLPNELSLLKTFACLIVDIELLQVITSHFVSAKVVIWKAFHILIRALYSRVVLPTSWIRFDPFQLEIVYPSNWKSFQLLTVSHFVLKPKSYHFPMHCMKSLRRQVVVVSLYSLVLLCKICKCLS